MSLITQMKLRRLIGYLLPQETGDLSRRLTPLGHRECEEAHIETSGFGTKRRLGNVRFCAACGPKRTSISDCRTVDLSVDARH